MRRGALFVALALVGAIAAADAQAPRITPRGDPSVKDDTIYRLAVRPEDHPEESAIVLLDDGVVRVEADGRSVSTFRQVTQILRDDAVERYQEHRFGYSPSHQKLTLNWIRVVGPDGKIISAKPTQEQDSDVPAAVEDPVYQERKVKRLSLSGVAPNTIVDYSYTLEELKPFHPGDFHQSWSVHMAMPVKRSRLIVDMPKSMTPRILERNLNFPRVERVAGNRKLYIWATKDIDKVFGEPFAADSNGILMSLAISAPITWQDIGRWYAGLAKDRYSLTPDIAAKVRELVKDARTRDDTIRAVHRWVAQDIRYVSISLGIGGYQPRTPARIVETGYGDCKDKATIFVAALKELGITAYPVLLSSSGGVERRLPTIEQFDHAIAAVPRAEGGYQFTDLTSELTPYGELPFPEQGEFALVIKPDGTTEEQTMPLDPIEANLSTERIVGAVSPDGRFEGFVEIVSRGARQYSLRSAFTHPLDSLKRANLLRSLGTTVFPGGEADSLVTFEGKNLQAVPKLAWRVRNARAVKSSGSSMILDIPETFGNPAEYEETARMLVERGTRRFPIDAAAVHGQSSTVTEMLLTLPDGWTARVPSGVNAASPFGVYASEYAQEGRVLRIRRTYTGQRGILPPDKVDELVAWLKSVAQDDARYILIDRKP